uniref:Uncharacterized protein n=1 Tax=Rhizophora mucronata TaxID=61149 RepID=A0A2P2PYK0_RHIMU
MHSQAHNGRRHHHHQPVIHLLESFSSAGWYISPSMATSHL